MDLFLTERSNIKESLLNLSEKQFGKKLGKKSIWWLPTKKGDTALDVTENLSKKQIRETVQHRLERTKNKMKRIFILQNGRIFKI